MFGVLHKETLRDVADAVRLRLALSPHETLLPSLVVQEFEGFLCVEGERDAGGLFGDDALVFAEDDGGRPEELALFSQVLDLLGSCQSCLVEGELPVLQSELGRLHLKYFKI